MLGENLNLKADSLVGVFMIRESQEKAIEEYKTIMQMIMDKFQSVLVEHFTKTELLKRAHECKTIEELEAMRYDIIPDNTFELLAEEVNAIETLKDSERVFMLIKLGDLIIFSAKQYTDKQMHQRAQTIASGKKSKLILP